MEPFISDLKKLEKGVEFIVRGTKRKFYGTLAIVSADNLGSLALGGFKESCSAEKMCRQCMTTRPESQKKFLEVNFELRTAENHKDQCALVEADKTGKRSKEYGINRDSSLNSLAYFHVCNGSLVPDIMHDVLEGALQYEVKLILQHMIYEENYFTLDKINSRLENLELGSIESKSRPTPISSNTLNSDGSSLRQNASQMWLLGRILPIAVGEYVPDDDERWALFLQLMDIVDILFAPCTSEDHAIYLATLISDHHHEFTKLYSDANILPKQHFMIHMPRMMTQFGPLVRHWTMRFEAKHSYFKQLAQSMGNFVNIVYSLAMRHQLYQSYLNIDRQHLPGWEHNLESGPGSVANSDVISDQLEFPVSNVFSCKWVKIDGNEYKLGAGVILDVKHDLPIVGVIQDIYNINGDKIFFNVNQFSTSYEPHYQTYILEDKICSRIIGYPDLFIYIAVHIRKLRVTDFSDVFILPFAFCVCD